ncbi:MAG: PAS domain S-box protein [Nitrospirae bacterium]|nr:PAS domain S-box protein [Nitrospirota bacterium]
MRRRRLPYAWLPVLVIVMTVAALAIGGLGLHYVESRLVAMTGESLSLAAAEIADKLDRFLFERYGDVQMMARAFSSQTHNGPYMAAYLAWMKKAYPVYIWLGVTDASGRVVAATDLASVGRDLSRREWFQAVRESGSVHVGDVEPYEVVGGVDAVAFTAPIFGPQGEFLGVVSTRVELSALEGVLTRTIRAVQAQQGFLGNVEYQFLTRQGIAFIDSDLLHKGNANLKRLGLPSALLTESSRSGYVEEEHLRRHVSVVTGYARTQGYQAYKGLEWGVLVRIDREDILAPIWEVLVKLGTGGAIVWVPMVALLLWATGRLRREWAQAQQESERARAAEVSLRESEERTRSIVETALDAVIVMDAEGRIVEWNSQAETIFGWPRQEMIGKRLSTTIIPPQYRDAHERGLRRFLATGEGPLVNKRVEVIACHRRGHEFPVELTIAPARHGETYTFSAFVRDIAERKQAENRQAAQVAISLILAESRTLHEAAPRLLRAVCDTMGWELGAMWHVDRAAARLRCEAVWHGATVDAKEFMALTQGSTFASGVGLPGRVWAGGEPAWIADVAADANFPRVQIAANTGLHGAFGFPIKKGGETLGVLEFFSREIRQPDAGVLQMMADIGVKIGQFVERILLEEQLRQSQKMEAVGQLAGGIAHDFNNLLTVIAGYCHLLLKRVGSEESLRGVIQEIQKAGDRAAGLTGQLLAFSRQQVLAPKVLDFNEVVAGIEAMLRRLIGENIALIVEPGAALGRVKADPGQIEQVIMNLAVNARDAMPKGGRLTIKMANVELGEADASQSVVTRPGRYVMLAVSDTGHGMDAETQARIFEPFFTTKDKSKGTGLGLSMVYGIVKQSGGYIFVRSDLQQGTTVTIYLPRVMEDVTAAESGRVAGELCRGTETILLVEDEDTIRVLLSQGLRSYGYDVLEACEADEALRISRQHAAPIHLLLTDVVMPGVSGRELVERLAPARPEMKVLYMSGYTNDVIVHNGVSAAGTAFLQKPFTPDVLARRVREVLDAPQPR